MTEATGSAEAEEGGTGSDDESGMRCRGSLSDPRWSRMTKGWRLRGVDWRVKLGVLPGATATVGAMRRASADGRRKYADLRRRLLVDPHIIDDDQTPSHVRMDNPLSLDPESVWGRYFRNAELGKTIDKDLTRLYPEHGVFFQSTPCQAMMRRILLVWSLIHPQFSYRQGMHELLAPLLYVLHVDVVRLSQVKHRFEDLFDDRFDSLSLQEEHVRDTVELAKNFCGEMIVGGDSINFSDKTRTMRDVESDLEDQRVDLSVIIQGSDMYGVEGELGALLSARFLEHDAYCMLDALLSGQGGAVVMAEYFGSSSGGNKPPVIEASAALYRTLAAADISLYSHLVGLGVEPQFFALRWLRLLFGREFHLDDLLRVWDAIFGADNTSLYRDGKEDSSETRFSQRSAIIFSLSVSMLLYVRPALLAAPDATACLQRLLNFPQVPDVRDLIESAKSLQLLAQGATRAPGPPVPRNTRSSEGRVGGKHARSGSISPPTPQHLVLRHQNTSCTSPEVLRLSMSLPESYWEEKWTHSILQQKTPEELFSPTTCWSEGAARGSDNADREASSNPGSLNRATSEGQHQIPRPDLQAANLSIRIYDSPDSSYNDGQEMLRRGEGASNEGAFLNEFIPVSTPIKSESGGSLEPSECDEQEQREYPGLDLGEDDSLASAPGQDECSHLDGFSKAGSTLTSEVVETAKRECCFGASTMEGDHDCVFACSGLGPDEDSLSQRGGLDACKLVLESNSDGTVSSLPMVSRGTLSDVPEMSSAGFMEGCVGGSSLSLAPQETSIHALSISNGSPQLQQNVALLSDSRSSSDVLATAVSKMSAEIIGMSGNEEGKCDTLPSLESSNSKIEEEDQCTEEINCSSGPRSLVLSKLKPPLPPGRLGRFNWMWNLGRNNVVEKTVSNKVCKEESSSSEVTTNLSGSVSDADTLTSAAAIAAQRRKKSWWRSNCDVVPEDSVAPTNSDSSSAADSSGDVLGQSDLVGPVSEPAIVAPEVQLKEDAVAEVRVTSLVEMPVPSEETPLKPKDMTPSGTLQALGQSVLEHVQVLESALAQKVSGLGIDHKMWTPAVREKSDIANRTGLGSKGQGAALAAIAELRKISQALQQM